MVAGRPIQLAFVGARLDRLGRELSGPPPVALVPTERVVEAGRVIKDSGEIARLREAGRRLSSIGLELAGFVTRRSVRTVDRGRHRSGDPGTRGFERPAFETIVASGAEQRPSARPAGAGGWRLATAWCWTSGASTTDTAWISRGRSSLGRSGTGAGSDCRRRSGRPSRPRIAAVRPGVPSERDRRAPRAACSSATAWRRRSAMGPGTVSGSKSTRSRGSRRLPSACRMTPVAAGHGVHHRARRLRAGARRRPDRRRRACHRRRL